MFAHAADLVAAAGNVRVVRLFARTLRVMVRGEIGQDMTAYDSRQNVRDYLNGLPARRPPSLPPPVKGVRWYLAIRRIG